MKGTLPEDSVQANWLRIRAARYTIIHDQLYKREQGQLILQEIHGGVCENHTGGYHLHSRRLGKAIIGQASERMRSQLHEHVINVKFLLRTSFARPMSSSQYTAYGGSILENEDSSGSIVTINKYNFV
ncbi:hypothetical protein ACS0TY_015128 [Phlomoides rotata]